MHLSAFTEIRRLRAGALAAALALTFGAASACADTRADTDEAVTMFVTLPIQPDALESFLPVMRENIAGSRAEPGNISFDVYRSEGGGADLFLIERWESEAALDTHMQTPHLQAVITRVETDLRAPAEEVRLTRLSDPAPWPEVDDPLPTRNLIVSLQIRPERRDEFVEALLATVEPARAAPGAIVFDVYQHEDDPNALVIIERWESPQAHEAHLEQPYNEPLNAIFEESLARPLAEGRRLLSDVSVPAP